ncbi:MAG: type II secretion system protein [Patescibacteria group bacterium]
MRRAFTIVELLIVVGIVGLLAALLIPVFGTWRERSVVRSAARDIESILKLARSKSLASEGGAKYGVLFYDGAANFSLCKNPAYIPDPVVPSSYNVYSCGTLINSHTLGSSLSFCAPYTSSTELKSLAPGWAVVPGVFFSKLTGEYENIDPASTEGVIYFYNKNKIASPCGDQPALDACLAAKTCGGVVITKSGVIYEK